MPTRYVIMANGKGTRWNGYLGVPKHLLEVDGETLLARIVRQVSAVDPDAEIIISSEDPRYEVPGAKRHSPFRNEIELDRFVPELITDDICFLYGDTFYTDGTMSRIIEGEARPFMFFANEKSIVAIKCCDSILMHRSLQEVEARYISGQIETCKGWQLYEVCGVELLGSARTQMDRFMIKIDDLTLDIDSVADYKELNQAVELLHVRKRELVKDNVEVACSGRNIDGSL